MTDFFGSVRNIELMEVNDSTLPALDELSGQSTTPSTDQSCQFSLPVSLTPPPLAAVSSHLTAMVNLNYIFLLGGGVIRKRT